MSLLRPSTAIIASLALVAPASAQTAKRGSTHFHDAATITFKGTVNTATSCPEVQGDWTIQLGDKGPKETVRISFDGQQFKKTGDAGLDGLLKQGEKKFAKECQKPVSQNNTLATQGYIPVFVQLLVAADATVTPLKNGCRLSDVALTPYIDGTAAGKSLQDSGGRFALPNIFITQQGQGYVVSAGGDTQYLSREDVRALPNPFAKTCGFL